MTTLTQSSGPKSGAFKILHTIRQGKIGGGERHVLDLVQSLDDERFESEVLSFTDGEMVDKLRELGIPCHVIHTELPFNFLIWKKVRRFIEKGGFDLVHAHGTRACSNTLKPAKKLGLPVIYTVHGWSFHQDQKPWVRLLRKISEKWLVRRTDLNINVSGSNQKDGRQQLDMPRSTVIYNAVDTGRFDPRQDFSLRRKDLKLPENKVIAGMVVRLTKQKNPLTFIKAAHLALRAGADMHFWIVGDGELREDCEKLARQLGIRDQITFSGFRTDVPAVLNLMDIYCLPSLWEGLPLGLLEAMAMRKAVVASPVDGSKEVINHGEDGFLMDEKNAQKLAESFIELSEDKRLRNVLGKRAAQKIHADFSVGEMTDQVETEYEDLLERPD